MQKITPFLWFNDNAEEALDYYQAIFKNTKIIYKNYYPQGMPMAGKLMTGTISIEGQDFHILNGGPQFPFTEAVSFLVNCETQEEVDYFWDSLTANGGSPSMCGWLKDKFGLSWQIIPKALGELMNDPDRTKAGHVMQAMMKMKRIIIADLSKLTTRNESIHISL